MLFLEQDAPLLKVWIVKRLETPSRNDGDVDADVLADYVLALLRHDGDANDVRKLCETELYDFLKDEAALFVEDVFEALSYKSYLQSAQPPPRREQQQPPPSLVHAETPTIPIKLGAGSDQGFGALQHANRGAPLPNYGPSQYRIPQYGSRKRSYHESSLPSPTPNGTDTQSRWEDIFPQGGRGGRAVKQPRLSGAIRGGRGGGRGTPPDSGSHMDVAAGLRPFVSGSGSLPFGVATYPAGPPQNGSATNDYLSTFSSDSRSLAPPVEEVLRMQQQMGLPLPLYTDFGAATSNQQTKASRRHRLCRNFLRKGFCTRSNCPFEHGAPVEYSPTNSQAAITPTSLLPFQQGAVFPMLPPLPLQYAQQEPQSPRQAKQRLRRGGKAHFSADGPVYDQSKSTIVVEGIPDEYLREADVRNFFSQFGEIVSVTMQPKRKLAVVEFVSWAAANAAYQSPKAIFDNRFVKVFWHKDDHMSAQANGKSKTTQAATKSNSISNENGESEAERATSDIDMDEFLHKQEEAQKLHEEKAQKKKRVEVQRQELEQRQKELLAKQLTERQRLVSKMAAVATTAKTQHNDDETSGVEASDTPTSAGDSKTAALSQTEMIRAQLAALEEEAKQLGIDPDAIVGDQATRNSSNDGASTSASWTPRDGGYVRGRGGFFYRGRGNGYMSRGGRPLGGTSSVYAAYSLDNRPRTVAVGGADFTAPDINEALRQYLLVVGDFTAIDTTEEAATITFTDRRAAEKFYFGLPRATVAKEGEDGTQTPAASRAIPGIDMPVELRWIAKTVPLSTTNPVTGSGPGLLASTHISNGRNGITIGSAIDGSTSRRQPVEEVDASMRTEDGEDKEEQRHPRLQRQNMDFDVADEGDWEVQ